MIAAFFDLDGTIVKGTSAIRFTRFLFRRKLLHINLRVVIPALKTAYDYLSGNISEYMDDSDDLFAMALKGLKKTVVEEQARQYAGLEMHYVFKKTLKIINEHKKKGHKLFLLSASNDEIVKEIGKLLGFDESFGTRFETKKGKITGKILSPSLIGKDRVFIVKKLAKKYKIDLKKSYSYGNCINDVFVLESVGNPVAVNPNQFLKPIAKKRKWKII